MGLGRFIYLSRCEELASPVLSLCLPCLLWVSHSLFITISASVSSSCFLCSSLSICVCLSHSAFHPNKHALTLAWM